MELSPPNGVACHHKAPSAFPNQFVPTHVGETMATGVEQPQQAAATVSPCRNRHVPVPPRFSAMLPKKTAGHADRQASPEIVLTPPRASTQGQRHREGPGTGGTCTGAHPAREREDGVRPRGAVRQHRLAPSDRDKALPLGSARFRSLDPFPFPLSAAASSRHRFIRRLFRKTGSLTAPDGAPKAQQKLG